MLRSRAGRVLTSLAGEIAGRCKAAGLPAPSDKAIRRPYPGARSVWLVRRREGWRKARSLRLLTGADAIGVDLADIDRDIGDDAIARLAFLSGQSEAHLLRGTMRPDVPIDLDDDRENVQRALLRHGDLVLNRSRRGRSKPIIQYRPVCLSQDAPYLRRGWRFSLEVVCYTDGCLLMDSCWCCGALLDPLSHGVPCTEFACVKCGAALAEAPSVCLSETVTDQRALYRELHRLAFIASHTFVGIPGQDYINMLSSGDLRGTNPSNAADRHNAVMLEALRLRQAPERHRDRPRSRKGAGSTAADHSDLSGFRSSGHSLGRILLRLGTGRERDRGERRLLLHVSANLLAPVPDRRAMCSPRRTVVAR